MDQTEQKRIAEQKLVDEMIRLYCRKKHRSEQGRLCQDCQRLSDYAREKVGRCPFMESKTFCSNCKVHCYNTTMRETIREVMKYCGPRLIFYHPWIAISHIFSTIKKRSEKR